MDIAQTCSVIDAGHSAIALHHACPAWIEFNSGGSGYYRTAWSDAQLNALDLTRLSAAERLMLVYDLRAAHSDSPLLKKLRRGSRAGDRPGASRATTVGGGGSNRAMAPFGPTAQPAEAEKLIAL